MSPQSLSKNRLMRDLVFGHVFQSRHVRPMLVKAIRETIDDEPLRRRAGETLVENFHRQVKLGGLFGLDKIVESQTMLEHFSRSLRDVLPYDTLLDQESLWLEVYGGGSGDVLEVSFDVWGEEADPDNYDEKANFDDRIESAVLSVTGPMRVSRTFKRNSWGGLSFVTEFRGSWAFQASYLVKTYMPDDKLPAPLRA